MDDTKPANEPNEPGLNKIDLSQLQTFNFGTQWTEVKPVSPGRRERDFDRGDRRDRREGGGAPGGQPRDRRAFRKPAGAPTGAPGGAPSGPAGGGQSPGGEPRRFDRGPGGPRREFRGEQRGDFRGDRREGGGQSFDRAPYVSPYFIATCYPEDTGFAAIVKAVRASCRTFQLFEITKAVLEKNDRFVVVLQRAKPAPGGEPAAKPGPLYMSMPDHLPFDTEDAAVQHALSNNLGAYFDQQEVEVEPPKGSYPIINKCGVTGELLGPPNYHRYQQILQQHYAAKIKGMSFDRFRDSIVSVREPEVAAAWLEKMKKAVRYTWKPPVARTTKPPQEAAAPAAESAPTENVAAESPAPAADTPAAPAAEAPAAETAPATPTEPVVPADAPAPAEDAPAEAAPAIFFDSIEEARVHLLTNARDRVVRTVESVRFHGKNIEKLPPGEIRRALEGHVERQRRFPLDTANALRGRLRREGFTIFKKGSRGVSYVCAVKRRFRVPGQVFSESIATLIDFIEKHPMAHVKDLPKNYLGLDLTPPAEAAESKPAEGSTSSQSPFAALPPEQAETLRKMSNDLRWLVMEGYVTEFSDGKLFAPPVMAPQSGKKAESGDDEHDPVDFPDAPAVEAPPAKPAPTAPASEEAPTPEATDASSADAPPEPDAPVADQVTKVPVEPAPAAEAAPAPESAPESTPEPTPPSEENKPGNQA